MLENIILFSNLTETDIAQLEAISQTRKVPKNTVVINEGDQTDNLYVIVSGRALALRSDESGRQYVVNRMGPMDYFGEMSLFDRDPRCATVITKAPCQLMIIARKDFLQFATQNPTIYQNVIKALLDKLRMATRQIDDLAFLDVYGRLARFLTDNQDESGVIHDKLTQQELADIVGASRETVCRILNELVDGDYISRQGNGIRLHKNLPYKF